MDEYKFLEKLEERAIEQEVFMKKLVAPGVVFSLSLWFGRHPWRFIIPFSMILSLLFRFGIGPGYTDKILWIFGGQ